MNVLNANRWTIALVGTLLLLFLYFIWPTPWQEGYAREGKPKHLVYHRVNILTGEKQFGYPGMFGMIRWLRDNEPGKPK